MEDVTEALRKQRSSSAVNGTRGPAVERLMMDGEIVVECDLMILGLGKQNPDAVHGRYYEHSQAQTMPARDIAYEVLKQAEDTGSYLTQCRAGQRVISADFKDLFEIVLGLQHTVRYLQSSRREVVKARARPRPPPQRPQRGRRGLLVAGAEGCVRATRGQSAPRAPALRVLTCRLTACAGCLFAGQQHRPPHAADPGLTAAGGARRPAPRPRGRAPRRTAS